MAVGGAVVAPVAAVAGGAGAAMVAVAAADRNPLSRPFRAPGVLTRLDGPLGASKDRGAEGLGTNSGTWSGVGRG